MARRLITYLILTALAALLLTLALAAWPPPSPPQRINFNQFLDDQIFIVYDLVMSNQYLTPNQAAKRIGVAGKTIRRWIHEGEFPNAYRLSSRPKSPYRIPIEDIEAYEARRVVKVDIKQK